MKPCHVNLFGKLPLPVVIYNIITVFKTYVINNAEVAKLPTRNRVHLLKLSVRK